MSKAKNSLGADGMMVSHEKEDATMNQLQIFNNPEFGEIRTTVIDDEPWFVGKDVASALGYSNTKDALGRHVDAEDKGGSRFPTPSGEQEMTIINESGLYSLVLSSKLEGAKKFKRWVTSEVIPSIRKHGAYMTPDTLDRMIASPEFGIRLLTELKNERDKNAQLTETVKAQSDTLEQQKPLVLFANAVKTSDQSVLVGVMAKILKQNGVEIGQNRLFDWLRSEGYLVKRKCADYNMPTQYSMDLGLFEIKESTSINPDGSIRVNKTPKITAKGQIYFVEKFLGQSKE